MFNGESNVVVVIIQFKSGWNSAQVVAKTMEIGSHDTLTI